MSKHIAKGPFVVLETYEQESRYGGTMTVITMANTLAEITHSYIDPANKNFKFWQDIITLQDGGYGVIIDNLKYKVKDGEIQKKFIKHWNVNEPLINADSKPTIVMTTDSQQEVLDRLVEVLND
jgi:hypothetical protein